MKCTHCTVQILLYFLLCLVCLYKIYGVVMYIRPLLYGGQMTYSSCCLLFCFPTFPVLLNFLSSANHWSIWWALDCCAVKYYSNPKKQRRIFCLLNSYDGGLYNEEYIRVCLEVSSADHCVGMAFYNNGINQKMLWVAQSVSAHQMHFQIRSR